MEENRTLLLNAPDVLVLMYHISRHAKAHGHMDADRTLKQLLQSLSFQIKLSTAVVESGLYSCNMMDEQNEFWHPQEMSFDAFVRKLTGGRSFNKIYNLFEEKI